MSKIIAKLIQIFLMCAIVLRSVQSQVSVESNVHKVPRQYGFGGLNAGPSGCPLCDSSVYSYCSHKLVHDACCCGNPYFRLPYDCQFSDCGFLHANSCQEHRLIAGCCCEGYGKK